MKILIDECLPRALKRYLKDHDCRSGQEMGWSGKKNCDLLSVAAGDQFEVLVTIDQGVEHQQHLAVRNIVLLVTGAAFNQIEDLLPIMPAARAVLDRIRPGTAVRVGAVPGALPIPLPQRVKSSAFNNLP